MENYKFPSNMARRRGYPNNKVRRGQRYVLLTDGSISFPKFYHYHQYLISVLLPSVLGVGILTDQNDNSAFQKMVLSHIKRFSSGQQYAPALATNIDTYLLMTASDIELLYINKQLPENLLKRLKSKNDGEMRGAIFEITIAAAFIRNGYKISWLREDSRPEFTAEKNTPIDVEAKRRNRVGKQEYDLVKEIRAIRSNLKLALAKKRDNPYMIVIDSDIPPKTSSENSKFYQRCKEEFESYDLTNTCVIITNNGYENDMMSLESGKNSTMVFLGQNGPSKEVIEDTIRSLHSELASAISDEWPI